MRGPFLVLRHDRQALRLLSFHASHPTRIVGWRQYSTPPIASPQHNEVKVNIKIGTGGFVPLRIRNPPRPSSDGPVILYLPPGLPSDSANHFNHDPLNVLALSAHATVVHIGYRLSKKDPYPKPIHDVLASYDWILRHLIHPNHNDISDPSHTSRLGVCGELIGGSLAAMLALTECHTSKPGITATALSNPIVDWTPPLPKPPPNEGSPLDRHLFSLREQSFAEPEHRYDPFASPLLFFRTPAFELPTPTYGFSPLLHESSPKQSSDDEKTSASIPKRRSHRKYPPLDSGLRLPLTTIEIGETAPLRDQGIEFAQVMQRSVDLYERGEGGYRGASDEARQRVRVVEREGKGLWGEREMMEIGAWFGEFGRRFLKFPTGVSSPPRKYNPYEKPTHKVCDGNTVGTGTVTLSAGLLTSTALTAYSFALKSCNAAALLKKQLLSEILSGKKVTPRQRGDENPLLAVPQSWIQSWKVLSRRPTSVGPLYSVSQMTTNSWPSGRVTLVPLRPGQLRRSRVGVALAAALVEAADAEMDVGVLVLPGVDIAVTVTLTVTGGGKMVEFSGYVGNPALALEVVGLVRLGETKELWLVDDNGKPEVGREEMLRLAEDVGKPDVGREMVRFKVGRRVV
ncbi:MAG: hypothetical protein Q9225_000213 [Loekoesia sp. 1 TL-2023]